jgi:hypothetical protein
MGAGCSSRTSRLSCHRKTRPGQGHHSETRRSPHADWQDAGRAKQLLALLAARFALGAARRSFRAMPKRRSDDPFPPLPRSVPEDQDSRFSGDRAHARRRETRRCAKRPASMIIDDGFARLRARLGAGPRERVFADKLLPGPLLSRTRPSPAFAECVVTKRHL